MTTSKHGGSPRAQACWKRLLSWYGARLGDQFGVHPPEDWARVIDEAKRSIMDAAMNEIRSKHPVHPPTFPQFYEIVSRLSRVDSAGPAAHERLRDFVMRSRKLTFHQVRAPWTFHFLDGTECVCVDIPDDGEVPGFRVRIADLPVDA